MSRGYRTPRGHLQDSRFAACATMAGLTPALVYGLWHYVLSYAEPFDGDLRDFEPDFTRTLADVALLPFDFARAALQAFERAGLIRDGRVVDFDDYRLPPGP